MPVTSARRGTLIAAAGQAVAAASGLLATLLLARVMAPEDFGRAMAILAGATVLSLAATLNIEAVAPRVLGHGPSGAQAAYLRFSRRLAASAAVALGAAGVLAGLSPEATLGLALAAVFGWQRMSARQAAALGRIGAGVLPRLLARPLALLALALGALAAGWRPGGADLLAMLALACAGAAALQTLALPLPASPGPADGGRWLLAGLGMAPALLVLEYGRDMALAVAALRLPAGDTALLALALTLASVPLQAVIAAEIGCGRAIAAGWAAGPEACDAALRQAAFLRLGGALALTAALVPAAILFRPWLPAAYGEGVAVLWLLLPVGLTRAALGPSVLLLTVAGRTGTVLAVCGPGAALAAGAIAAASAGGLVAAAAAIGLSFSLIHAALWLACRRATGADPSALAILRKPRGIAAAPDRAAPCPVPSTP